MYEITYFATFQVTDVYQETVLAGAVKLTPCSTRMVAWMRSMMWRRSNLTMPGQFNPFIQKNLYLMGHCHGGAYLVSPLYPFLFLHSTFEIPKKRILK